MVVKLSSGHVEAKRCPLTEVPAGRACCTLTTRWSGQTEQNRPTTLNVSAVSTDDHNR